MKPEAGADRVDDRRGVRGDGQRVDPLVPPVVRGKDRAGRRAGQRKPLSRGCAEQERKGGDGEQPGGAAHASRFGRTSAPPKLRTGVFQELLGREPVYIDSSKTTSYTSTPTRLPRTSSGISSPIDSNRCSAASSSSRLSKKATNRRLSPWRSMARFMPAGGFISPLDILSSFICWRRWT